jgi:formylglycine-generating enzyme required for sulfatase activity
MKPSIFCIAIASAVTGLLSAQETSTSSSSVGVNASSTNPTPADGGSQYLSGKNHSTILPNKVSLDLVWIPSGVFTMGSPASESGSEKWEHPQTIVTISKGFWMGKTPVTQGQYQALMGTNPSHFLKAGVDAPVEQVSWDDAMAFCQKLTKQERSAGYLPQQYEFTLPTEAQWEYACRAGSTGPRYSDDISSIAWYGNPADSTHPVGQKQPNALGLYDMLGNVLEWCSDWFGDYPGGRLVDPAGPASGFYRVTRGASWWSSAADCRSAGRLWESQGYPYSELLGFRISVSSVR